MHVRAHPILRSSLGDGYNDAVIAYKFPEEVKKDSNVNDSNLNLS